MPYMNARKVLSKLAAADVGETLPFRDTRPVVVTVAGATKTMSARQVRFVDEYIATGNGAEAARRAGYRVKSARMTSNSLLLKPHIQELIRQKEAELCEKARITQESVLAKLVASADRTDDKASHSAQVQALRLLGEYVGLFQQRPTLEVILAALPAELSRMLREALARHFSSV